MHRARAAFVFRALVCAALLAGCAHARVSDGVALPRPLATGERVVLEVELGAVNAGTQIVLRTPEGQLIGTVSPHGLRHGAAAGTYLVPVPDAILREVLRDGRIRVQVLIESSDAAPRQAGSDEVRDLRATVVPE